MKKIIITRKQLCEAIMNEEDAINVAVQAKNNSISDFSAAMSDSNNLQNINKAKQAGDVNAIISGPDSNDSQPQQVINVTNGDTPQTAIQKQGNEALLKNGGSMKIVGTNFGENKCFNKKSIEEQRLKLMEKNGKKYTKKELQEEFNKK